MWMALVGGKLMTKASSEVTGQRFIDPETRAKFLSFGDPRKILANLAMLKKNDEILCSKSKVEQMRKDYADQWVCLYDGRVVVSAETRLELLNKMDEQEIPREASHTEFMARKPISLFL